MKDKIVKNYCTKIRENGKNWNDEKCKGQKELQVITYEYLKYPWIFKISLLLPEIQCEIFQEYIMQYKKFTQCTVLSRPKIEHITREYRIILPKSKLVQNKKKKKKKKI